MRPRLTAWVQYIEPLQQLGWCRVPSLRTFRCSNFKLYLISPLHANPVDPPAEPVGIIADLIYVRPVGHDRIVIEAVFPFIGNPAAVDPFNSIDPVVPAEFDRPYLPAAEKDDDFYGIVYVFKPHFTPGNVQPDRPDLIMVNSEMPLGAADLLHYYRACSSDKIYKILNNCASIICKNLSVIGRLMETMSIYPQSTSCLFISFLLT